jgi:hypothetical protein
MFLIFFLLFVYTVYIILILIQLSGAQVLVLRPVLEQLLGHVFHIVHDDLLLLLDEREDVYYAFSLF